jgi:hypothetical protein
VNTIGATVDPGAYCREVEAYLCRKNQGHLIRIVGPAFEQVAGWARAGVPIQAVTRGIDRKLGRYVSGGRPRRPLRIEHCAADVLEAFDEWRRAVGVSAAGDGRATEVQETAPAAAPRRGVSLPAHIDRVLTQATTLLALVEAAPGLHAALEPLVADLDALRHEARGARGPARTACLEHVAAADQRFMARVRLAAGPALDEVGAMTDRELAPFKPRMADAVYAKVWSAAAERALRERFRLPTVRFD